MFYLISNDGQLSVSKAGSLVLQPGGCGQGFPEGVEVFRISAGPVGIKTAAPDLEPAEGQKVSLGRDPGQIQGEVRKGHNLVFHCVVSRFGTASVRFCQDLPVKLDGGRILH